MDIQDYLTDPQKETQGVWVDYQDSRLLVAANQNPNHARSIDKFRAKHAGLLSKAGTHAEGLQKVITESVAEALLLNWENVFLKGVEIPCTPENKALFLRSRRLRDFVLAESDRLSNYLESQEQESQAALKSGDSVAG